MYIHPTATVEDAEIGENTSIWHYSHIRKGAKVGSDCVIGKSVYIGGQCIIGDRCRIQNNVSIFDGVIIESDVFIGPDVTFTNINYPRAFISQHDAFEKTFVKKGASIGANSTILPGVVIGEFCLVGAASVVTRNVSPHLLVAGNPIVKLGYVCYCGKNDFTQEQTNPEIFTCNYCKTVARIQNNSNQLLFADPSPKLLSLLRSGHGPFTPHVKYYD